jgi:hypothetical protein
MRPFFFFRWRRRGRPWGRREAGRRRHARLAPVREEEEGGRLGREGGLGRPRPSGEGGEKWLVEKKKMGRGWAERPDGPKVTGKFFSE